MGRKLKQRVPAGPDGPESLQPVYDRHRTTSEKGAVRVIAALAARELAVTESNWTEVLDELRAEDPDAPTCSWRTAQRPGCLALLDEARGRKTTKKAARPTAAQLAAARRSHANALVCIAERDAKITELEGRIKDLEERNRKLARGTKPRRRRLQKRPVGESESTGSEPSEA